MSLIRTFTVTVAGGKFVIDGVSFTLTFTTGSPAGAAYNNETKIATATIAIPTSGTATENNSSLALAIHNEMLVFEQKGLRSRSKVSASLIGLNFPKLSKNSVFQYPIFLTVQKCILKKIDSWNRESVQTSKEMNCSERNTSESDQFTLKRKNNN